MILVVDDEAVVAEALSDILESLGYDVVSACGPKKAVDVVEARGSAVEVAIIDFNLRGTDGPRLFRQLKERQPKLRGVLTTGNPYMVSEGTWRKPGFESCLAKPFHVNDLADAVETAMRAAGGQRLADTGQLSLA